MAGLSVLRTVLILCPPPHTHTQFSFQTRRDQQVHATRRITRARGGKQHSAGRAGHPPTKPSSKPPRTRQRTGSSEHARNSDDGEDNSDGNDSDDCEGVAAERAAPAAKAPRARRNRATAAAPTAPRALASSSSASAQPMQLDRDTFVDLLRDPNVREALRDAVKYEEAVVPSAAQPPLRTLDASLAPLVGPQLHPTAATRNAHTVSNMIGQIMLAQAMVAARDLENASERPT